MLFISFIELVVTYVVKEAKNSNKIKIKNGPD